MMAHTANEKSAVELELEREIKRELRPFKWGTKEKGLILLILVLAIVNLFLNILSLGPDILHW